MKLSNFRIEKKADSQHLAESVLPEKESVFFPLSLTQHRMWSISQIEGVHHAYNIFGSFYVEGDFHADCFEKSVHAMAVRHEILRTSIVVRNGQPMQRVNPPDASTLAWKEWHADSDSQVMDILNREEVHEFDFENAPLFRVGIIVRDTKRHFFYFNLHHIIFDGWSVNIFLNELEQYYRAFLTLSEPAIADLDFQYRHFTSSQLQAKANGVFNDHQKYWVTRLSGQLPRLELPLDYLRPSEKNYEGGTAVVTISQKCIDLISRQCEKLGATPFMILFSGVYALLNRYTDSADMILGTSVAGRTDKQYHNQLGLYMNLLPIRIQIDSEESFDNLSLKVKNALVEALSYQEYPFDMLVDALAVERDLSRAPLFDVLVSMRYENQKPFMFGEGQVKSLHTGFATSKYDLSFNFITRDEDIQLEIEYDANLFSVDKIKNMLQHYSSLLELLLQDGATAIWKHVYLSTDEQRQQLVDFKGPEVAMPDISVVDLFSKNALMHPDSIAVVDGSRNITYKSLYADANNLASQLIREFNLAKGDRVIIIANPGYEMIKAIMGTVKSGGVYVPIDPSFPPDRIEKIVKACEPVAILTDDPAAEGLSRISSPVLHLSNPHADVPRKENFNIPISGEDLAYIIYTSGSTGDPKGVMINHKSLYNRIEWMWNNYSFDQTDVILQKTPFTFDVSVWEIFMTLTFGAKLVTCSRETVYNPDALHECMVKNDITTLHFVPSALTSYCQYLSLSRPKLCQSVKRVICSGEALKPETVQQYYSIMQAPLFNLYGPTEATVDVTAYATKFDDTVIPIGKAIQNIFLLIVDSHRQLVPIGIPGEIVIGGIGVADGYFRNQKLTEAAFIDNPFSNEGKLYLTGDIGKFMPDGNILYSGRKDFQVKLRGYRIELGEIEAILSEHPFVKEAVVKLETAPNPMLVAYFVSEHDSIDGKLANYLGDKLPFYMIPSRWVRMDRFPVNNSGKINRSALQAQYSETSDHPGALTGSATYATLLKMWQELLETQEIAPSQSFFALGGDSIKAITLVGLIAKAFGKKVQVKDVFRNQSLHSLVRFIEEAQSDNHQDREERNRWLSDFKQELFDDASSRNVDTARWEDAYRISNIQLGLIFHYELGNEASLYHEQFYYQFEEGELDLVTLKKSFDSVIAQHSVLRTSFHMHGFKEPYQLVHTLESVNSEIHFFDISNLSRTDQKRHLQDFMMQDRQSPFDLSVPGLFRIFLFRLSHKEYGLLWVFHHAILDGWSNASLMTMLVKNYYQLRSGNKIQPIPFSVTYKDYVAQQHLNFQENRLNEFWTNELEGFTRTQLPFNRIANDSGYNNDYYAISISANDCRKINETALEYNIGVKDIYLAAFCELIRFVNNVREITVGMVTNGRLEEADGENVLGCFLNSVPFRHKFGHSYSGRKLLTEISAKLQVMKEFDILPLNQIKSLSSGGKNARAGIFDILFGYIDFHIFDELPAEFTVKKPLVNGYERTNTLFDFTVFQRDDRVNVIINFANELYSRNDIRRIGYYYRKILKSLLYSPDSAILAENILSPEEILFQRKSFTGSIDHFNLDFCIDELVDDICGQYPDRTAVVSSGVSLSYRGLKETSDRLASWMHHENRVGAGQFVAIMLNRDEWSVISMLAVLKTGAAYIPINPEYPEHYVKRILETTGTTLLVTSSEYIDRLDGINCQIIAIDIQFEMMQGSDTVRKHSPDDVAYAIFTSGSTGEPKGVPITHRALLNTQRWRSKFYNFDKEFNTLQVASLSFDSSVNDIFSMLLCGGCITIANSRERLNPSALLTIISENGITNFNMVPSFYWAVVNQMTEVQARHLKVITLAGEKLTGKLVEQHFQRLPSVPIINEYGPTENSICSSALKIQNHGNYDPSIGKPISNTSMHILTDALELAPLKTVGQIYLSGAGLSEGYISGREDINHAFIENPFIAGTKLYKTGDLARLLENGEIEYVGRTDDQIKLRGYRIDFNEINSVLNRHPLVEGSYTVLVGGEDEHSNKMLVSYVQANEQIKHEDAVQFLNKYLPLYMIPNQIITLEKFPLTINGKIDRSALISSTEVLSEEVVRPENEVEEEMLGLWQSVLKKKIGVTDDFFEAGGDSILAIQLSAKIQDRMASRIEVADIFSAPSVRQLCHIINQNQRDLHPIAVVKFQEQHYEASLSQKRFYFLHHVSQDKTLYNLPGCYRISGPLNSNALRDAFHSLIQRHESLRTSFHDINGEVRQRVHHGEDGFSLEFIDLTHDSESERTWFQLMQEMMNHVFDLQQLPLCKIKLMKLRENDHVLIMNIHHIISDEWSMDVMMKDLSDQYNFQLRNNGLLPEPLRIQYKDYVQWVRQKQVEQLQENELYWLGQFSGAIQPLNLPVDFARGTNAKGQALIFSHTLQREEYYKIDSILKKEKASLYMMMLTSVNIFLHKITSQEDIIIGTPTAGRVHPDLESQIGLYINTLALRTSIQPTSQASTILHNIKRILEGALRNELYSFEELVRKLNVKREKGRNPLFDVWVVYQDQEKNDFNFSNFSDGLEITEEPLPYSVSRYDIKFTFIRKPLGLNIVLEFNEALFRKETGEALAAKYKQTIQNVIHNFNSSIADWDIQPPVKRKLTVPMEKMKITPALRTNMDVQSKMRSTLFLSEEKLPIVIQAGFDGIDLNLWLSENRNDVQSSLNNYGAVLFRGFSVNTIDDFELTVRGWNNNVRKYDYASTPRTNLKEGIYTSTEYPADQKIQMHNEMAYTREYPSFLWFYCSCPAEKGGQTPIADSRKIYTLLSPDLIQLFESKKIMYVRNYHKGIDLPWQKAFQTEDKLSVENYCRSHGINFEWISDDHLRTQEICEATKTHPITGEKVWFNQAHLFHASNVGGANVASDSSRDFPRNALFGDATQIELKHIQEIKQAYDLASLKFDWKKNDVLLLDNLLAAHGREPFVGKRVIMVAMH